MPADSTHQNTSEAARWRLIRRKVIQRFSAVTIGIGLFFFVAFLPAQLFGNAVWLWVAADIVSYTIGGVVLGFIWPDMSWRLGIWLFAVWPLIILLAFLISDPPRVINWKEELLSLLGYLMILPGACLGAWIGSLLRLRFTSKSIHGENLTPSS